MMEKNIISAVLNVKKSSKGIEVNSLINSKIKDLKKHPSINPFFNNYGSKRKCKIFKKIFVKLVEVIIRINHISYFQMIL